MTQIKEINEHIRIGVPVLRQIGVAYEQVEYGCRRKEGHKIYGSI